MIEVTSGDGPVILGLPHTGTVVPDDIAQGFNATGQALADTDWHIDRLYADLIPGLTTVRTPIHRYVIDVNRAPDGQSLYPGQNTTSLCPLTDFDGLALYYEGQDPDAAEVERRRVAYHAPYHTALQAQITRVRDRHGFAILYDCHSIRSEIPFLFDGILPDFNIGTNFGRSCDEGITAIVTDVCQNATGFSTVRDGRFKGGWTTRHYGQPGSGVHAIQMELAQSTYMLERPPWTLDAEKSATLRPALRAILQQLSDWKP